MKIAHKQTVLTAVLTGALTITRAYSQQSPEPVPEIRPACSW